ncbi:MAG: hypothetical protein A4E69_01949 [Syntrophus sp. PtaB.Bin138]|nr:MAG: hypothetical protein A4E69_01949 [Syntrophus sp. PtaB.Bin138]
MNTLYCHWAPVWDAHIEVARLRGVVDLIAILTGPVHCKNDSEFAIFHEVFADLSDRLAEVEKTLTGSLDHMKTLPTQT